MLAKGNKIGRKKDVTNTDYLWSVAKYLNAPPEIKIWMFSTLGLPSCLHTKNVGTYVAVKPGKVNEWFSFWKSHFHVIKMRETTNHTSCCLVTKRLVSLDRKLNWQMLLCVWFYFCQKRLKFNFHLCQNKFRNVCFFRQTLHQWAYEK